MEIPIIVSHLGNQSYFHKVLEQAKRFNKNVYAIGDSIPPCQYDIKDYSERANKLSAIYEHLSTNGYVIELMCFNRWNIMLEFMEKHNIPVAFHIDTDVLIFTNVTEEWERFSQFDFTLSHRCCGSNSFFTIEGLKGICDFFTEFYSDKNSYTYHRLAAHYHIRRKFNLNGGVCDMTLLEHYSYLNCGKVGEMMHIFNSSTYDHSINESDQYYRMKGGIKDITFKNKLPYCHQEKMGKDIQFKTLHFQGPAKNLIQRIVDENR